MVGLPGDGVFWILFTSSALTRSLSGEAMVIRVGTTRVCHMSSRFTGVLMSKRRKALKTRTGSLGKEENWERTQNLIILSCPPPPAFLVFHLSRYEYCRAALSSFLVFRDSAPWFYPLMVTMHTFNLMHLSLCKRHEKQGSGWHGLPINKGSKLMWVLPLG